MDLVSEGEFVEIEEMEWREHYCRRPAQRYAGTRDWTGEAHVAGGGAGTMVSATCMSLLEDSGRLHLCPSLWPGRREWSMGGRW